MRTANRAGLRVKSGINAGGQTAANHSRAALVIRAARGARSTPAARAR
jgi:hypothetical protein